MLFASAPSVSQPVEPARPAEGDVRIPVTVRLGQVELGQPVGNIREDGQLTGFWGPEIIDLLRQILVTDRVDLIRAGQTEDRFVPLGALNAAGVETLYSASELVLQLAIPIELRTPFALSIAARTPPYENFRLTAPAKASAYVNFLAADDYLSRDGVGSDRGRQPAVIDFDGAAHALGTTLEASSTYRETSPDPWNRGDVRLVKDFPDARNRLTFGDLNYGTTGFQAFDAAGGVSLARDSNLQPYRVTTSTGDRTFTLDRRSQVDILINGRRVRTLDLDPGRYNLRDLPLAPGTNDVTLRIVDEVGRVQTIQFPFVFDTALLAPGEHEFSYAVGVRSRETPRSKYYDDHDPVASAYHTVGVMENLTLGTNVQAAEHQNVVGAEARLGTPLGIFRADLAVSESDFAPTDFAARLQYRFTEAPTPDSSNRNLLANVSYRGKSFLPINSTEAANPTSVSAGIVYGQRLPLDMSGSVGYSAQFDSGGSPQGYAYDITVSKQLTDSLFFDVFGRLESQRESEDEMTALFTLSWIPFQSRHRMSVQYDTSDKSQRVDWSYTPEQLIGGVQAYVSAEKLPETSEERLRTNLNYLDYRFSAQLRDDELYGGTSTSARRTTGLRLGTALAFADGHVGITRPISDGFVMVVPHASLKDRTVEVNPGGVQPQARSDAVSPAILSSVPSYYVQRVTVDVPDVPDGYDLGDQVYNVQLRYRSGALVTVGSGATAAIEGVLTDPSGRPIDLRLGVILSLDVPDAEAKPFFTDASGAFQVIGLVPGRYELRLDAAPQIGVGFEVPAGVAGIYSVGTLLLPLEPAQ